MNADETGNASGDGGGSERVDAPGAVTPASGDPATSAEPGEQRGIDELSDYLDRGRLPYDPVIEESPELRRTLRALERVRALSGALIDDDAEQLPAPEAGWFGSILSQVRRESRAGRDIPLASVEPDVSLSITEGAVRGLVREAGDSVPGVLVGRCRLVGDVGLPGADVVVEVTIAVFWGVPIAEAARQVRERVHSRLLTHTELRVSTIDVRVEDVYLPEADES